MLKKRMKEPLRIPYVPRWKGPIEGHAVNVAKSFYPKLCAFHEFDDLLQEAFLIYMKIKNTYPYIDNRAWFMSLFSVSLRNRMIGLIEHRATRYNFIEDATEIEEPSREDNTLLGIMLKELPQEAQDLLVELVGTSQRKARSAYRRLSEMFPAVAAT